jgi:Carboxypeptidase regulatory-like domain
MKYQRQLILAVFLVVLKLTAISELAAAAGSVTGTITDPQGRPVSDALIVVIEIRDSKIAETRSDSAGRFSFVSLPAGDYRLAGTAMNFGDVSERISIAEGGALTVNLRFEHVASHNEALTVTADVRNLGIQNPDPAQRVLVRDELLTPIPAVPVRRYRFPGFPSRPHRVASKRRNTSLPAWPATMANRSHRSFRWEAS